LLLAVGTGLASIITGAHPRYSPEVAVLTVTLIAIIWYTAFTYETLTFARERDLQELRRARASLATALLSELRWLYSILEDFARGQALHGEIATPVLDSALQQATLFTPDTNDRLAHVITAIRRLRGELDTGPRNSGDLRRPSAAATCIAISDLVPLLQSEGGQLPRFSETESIAPSESSSALPLNPFKPGASLTLQAPHEGESDH
jgi:hypothetical protein